MGFFGPPVACSWRRQWHPTPVLLPGKSHGQRSLWAAVYGVAQSRTRLKRLSSSSIGFPGGSDGEASACNAGDLGSIPGSGRCPGEENGNSVQYSCLENPMDCSPPGSSVHGVARVRHNLETKQPPHHHYPIIADPHSLQTP